MPLQTAPFVGRRQELATLLARLDAAGAGQGGVVLITGEPGIGKTRLLAELAARSRAWLVLSGRGDATEGAPPYLPFTEALCELAESVGVIDLQGRLGDDLPLLTALLPDLRRQLPSLPAAAPLPPEIARYRLFDGVATLLTTVASETERHGVLLLLDDLHWADSASLLLVHHLARRLSSSRCVLVGTYRPSEREYTPALRALLANLRRDDLADELRLAPLSPGDLTDLIAQVAGSKPAEVVVSAIAARTDGNPFFASEVLHDLLVAGWDVATPQMANAARSIPEGVRQVLGARVAHLPPAASTVVRMAAVLGNRPALEVLAAACGLAEEPLAAALDELERAALVRPEGDGYAFNHALVRETVYEGVNPVRRQRLHRQAADALEHVYAADLAPHAAVIASHHQQAGPVGDRDKALGFAMQAAEGAEQVLAWEMAAERWDLALALLGAATAPAARRQRAAMLDRLGYLFIAAGVDFARARPCLEEALDLVATLGDERETALAQLSLGRVLSMFGPQADLPRHRDLLDAAEGVLGRLPPSRELGEVYGQQASFGHLNVPRALRYADKAMALADQLGDAELWSQGALGLGWHLVESGQFSAGLTWLERAWADADRLDNVFWGFHSAMWRGLARLYLLDPRDARLWFERELARPRQSHAPVHLAFMRDQQNCARAFTGELAEAARHLAEVSPGLPGSSAADVHFWSGNWAEAEAPLRFQVDDARRTGNRWLEWVNARQLGQVYAAQGESDRAVALWLEVLPLVVAGGCVLGEVLLRTELARALGDAGQVEEARAHLALCHAVLAMGEDWRGFAGCIALAMAVIEAADRRFEAATLGFDEAQATFRRYTLPWHEADTLFAWGRAPQAAGDDASAADKLSAALAIYERYGAGEPWQRRIRTVLRQVPGRSEPAMYPDGLTAREVEVLQLIAVGKSSREIADTLTIAEGTVERHVTNLYGKIGARNRAAATSYAHRHGLAG